MTPRLLRVTVAAAGIALVVAGVRAAQEPGRTQQLAKVLTDLLQQQKLDAAAARLDENTFVAALYYPETELLVVSARYAAPSLLVKKLAEKSYRDVYMDLASASEPDSKVLIEDLKADGIRPDRDGDNPFDVVTRGTAAPVNFDGDATKANLSDQDYAKLFKETQDAYVRDLQALIDQLKKAQ